MVQLKRAYASGMERMYLDSLMLDEDELMPEEIAVLKMIHSTSRE